MTEKTTANQNYPKPDKNNYLQDDVGNIENALDMIDQDIHTLKQGHDSHAQAIADYVDNLLVGSVAAFANDTPHEGWLECNGQEVSRATYSRLFNKIGTTYGSGDGTATFNVPDLRGEFIRGWDHDKGVDANRAFASLQDDLMQGHTHADTGHTHTSNDHTHIDSGHTHTDAGHRHPFYHSEFRNTDGAKVNKDLSHDSNFGRHTTYTASTACANISTNSANLNSVNVEINPASASLGEPIDSGVGQPRLGMETRPRNIALMYCIKF